MADGSSVPDPEPVGSPDTTQPAGPGYAAGGSQSLPEPPHADPSSHCSAEPVSMQLDLSWKVGAGLYGIVDTPLFGFSPDGSRLITPSDQYGMDGGLIYSVADGSQLRTVAAQVLDRDAAWSHELRVTDQNVYPAKSGVVDLATENVVLDLGQSSWLQRFSADGRYLLGLSCQGSARLERRQVPGGQLTAPPLEDLVSPCSDQYYPGNALYAVTASGDAALFSGPQRNQVVVANIATRTATTHVVYDPQPDTVTGPPLDRPVTLALSPSEHTLATVSGGGKLRLWSYPAFAQTLPDIQIGVTQAFHDCYCTPHDFAPVAWSPDERYLATSDESGNTVVRRACDGAIIATVPPLDLDDHPTQSPGFLAFNPNGTGLAVISFYDYFGSVLAYYSW